MTFCIDHRQFFHAEINEDCPDCEEIKRNCPHENKGPSKLFDGCRSYYGLPGLWDVCYDCGKMIPYMEI
jgi:hypothetical protein